MAALRWVLDEQRLGLDNLQIKEHTLIRRPELGFTSEHDSGRFEEAVAGDERTVVTYKAYWSRERSAWLEQSGIENGTHRRGARNGPLGRFLNGVRARIESVFSSGNEAAATAA